MSTGLVHEDLILILNFKVNKFQRPFAGYDLEDEYVEVWFVARMVISEVQMTVV